MEKGCRERFKTASYSLINFEAAKKFIARKSFGH